MEQVYAAGIRITGELNGKFTISKDGNTWFPEEEYIPYIELTDGRHIPFCSADTELKKVCSGIGKGLKWVWSNVTGGKGQEPFSFSGEIWIEYATGDILFSLKPVQDGVLKAVHWPAPLKIPDGEEGYSVLPMMQGILLPYRWPEEVKGIEPPCFFERHGYMPWIGQVCSMGGWMAIAETPWDAGYGLEHPAGGPTRLEFIWQESLGCLSYGRNMRLILFKECNYVDLCRKYREYVRERGSGRSLKEKMVRYPKIKDLIGSAVVHTEIKYELKEESIFYEKDSPENNSRLTSFEERARQLEALHSKGMKKLYVHLDGWGKRGYDREHPDILPPCQEAGGEKGLRTLAETCSRLGYRLALHDQYRDYYTDASTYDPSNAVMLPDRSRPGECTWNGGPQKYLCASLAPAYVRRNYHRLREMGIEPDGAYLDVFSVVHLDECADPDHPMTRKECSGYRCECFRYIAQHYGIVSSEEPLANTVDDLALCHHAPYPTAPGLGGGKARGIPVPLFNLVYHDCIMIPWSLEEGEESVMPDHKSGFLHALLNGGLGYLPIEPDEKEIEKAEVVARLHAMVALEDMVNHEMLDESGNCQRTVFSNGVVVEVDFAGGSYHIKQIRNHQAE